MTGNGYVFALVESRRGRSPRFCVLFGKFCRWQRCDGCTVGVVGSTPSIANMVVSTPASADPLLSTAQSSR